MEYSLDVWLVEERVEKESEGDLDTFNIRLEVFDIRGLGSREGEDSPQRDEYVKHTQSTSDVGDVLDAADARTCERRKERAPNEDQSPDVALSQHFRGLFVTP